MFEVEYEIFHGECYMGIVSAWIDVEIVDDDFPIDVVSVHASIGGPDLLSCDDDEIRAIAAWIKAKAEYDDELAVQIHHRYAEGKDQ